MSTPKSKVVERHDLIEVWGTGNVIRDGINIATFAEGYTNANVKYDPTMPSTIPVRLIDTTRAEKTLGFKPSTNLREGLMKTVARCRESINRPRPLVRG